MVRAHPGLPQLDFLRQAMFLHHGLHNSWCPSACGPEKTHGLDGTWMVVDPGYILMVGHDSFDDLMMFNVIFDDTSLNADEA